MPSIIKVTDLAELTTPADGDFIPIVDISEPIDIDKTKKISVLNLVVAKITAAFAAYIPTLIAKRQGGSSSDWSTGGSSDYVVNQSNVKIQTGSQTIALTVSGGQNASVSITFPIAFTNKPIVIVGPTTGTGQYHFASSANSITNTGFNLKLFSYSLRDFSETLSWIAIGE